MGRCGDDQPVITAIRKRADAAYAVSVQRYMKEGLTPEVRKARLALVAWKYQWVIEGDRHWRRKKDCS